MMRLFHGSIFRLSFLLAFGGALLLATASVIVILTTPVPLDFPVSTLDVARALRKQPFAQHEVPMAVQDRAQAGFETDKDDPVVTVLIAAIARQARVSRDRVRMTFPRRIGGIAERQFDIARRKYDGQLVKAARMYSDDDRFSPLIFGSFKVAMQLPDGRWRTVARAPAAPQWQYNIAKGISIVLLAMFPLTWWFSRRLALPIRAFGDSANRIGAGSYEEVRVEGTVEIRQAARAMNQMQARIRRQINERAEMLAAIAHDLRTPLARLSFLIGDQPLANRTKIDDEIAEMDKMIGTTMDYVRSEMVEPAREKIDLRLLLESAVDDLTDLGHRAMLHSGPSIVIAADPLMLRRVFANVIGNAATHGKTARVKAFADGGIAHVEIRDKGPGMTDEDIARAFDPFFRAERSRNRDTGGIGLGLAVAKRGVEAHGGTIELANLDDGGLLVSISLPGVA